MKKLGLAVACILAMGSTMVNAEVVSEKVIPVINVPVSQLEAIKVQSSRVAISEKLGKDAVGTNDVRAKREKMDKRSHMKEESLKGDKKVRKDKRKNTDCYDGEPRSKKEMKEKRHDKVRVKEVKEVKVHQKN